MLGKIPGMPLFLRQVKPFLFLSLGLTASLAQHQEVNPVLGYRVGGKEDSRWRAHHEKRHGGKNHYREFGETTVLLQQKLCRRDGRTGAGGTFPAAMS